MLPRRAAVIVLGSGLSTRLLSDVYDVHLASIALCLLRFCMVCVANLTVGCVVQRNNQPCY